MATQAVARVGLIHVDRFEPSFELQSMKKVSTSHAVSRRPWFIVFAGLLAFGATSRTLVAQHNSNDGLDSYGGFKEITVEATGWFRVEKIRGRHVLVTPEGHPFVALGINHVASVDDGKADGVFQKKYGGSWAQFGAELRRQMKEWGHNAVDEDLPPEARKGMPYLASQMVARTSKYLSDPGGNNPYHFPDVFDPAIRGDLEQQVVNFCREHRENRYLIGYNWTDTPMWDLRKTRQFRGTDWVSEIRKLRSDAPGRRSYLEFVRKQYPDIAAFNRAYGLTLNSLDDLNGFDFGLLDLKRYEVFRDDEAFLGLIAQTYYKFVGEAARRTDPNHLIFGEKYLMGDHPDVVLEAGLPYIDVLAAQPGDGYIPIYVPGDVFPKAEMEELYEQTGKPIFICDHQISFATHDYPVATWPYHQHPNERSAAEATYRFLTEAFERPYLIGYMRCQYLNHYSQRRAGMKQGYFREDGSPYELLLRKAVRANHEVRESVRSSLR